MTITSNIFQSFWVFFFFLNLKSNVFFSPIPQKRMRPVQLFNTARQTFSVTLEPQDTSVPTQEYFTTRASQFLLQDYVCRFEIRARIHTLTLGGRALGVAHAASLVHFTCCRTCSSTLPYCVCVIYASFSPLCALFFIIVTSPKRVSGKDATKDTIQYKSKNKIK